jgi:hypothetical protein
VIRRVWAAPHHHDFMVPCLVYAEGMKVLLVALLVSVLSMSVAAQTPSSRQLETVQYDAKHPPRFEDFPVNENWNPPPAAVKLTTRAERMFKTRLTDAAKEPPNFAGHYRLAYWGCGSNCAAGALVDLQTGKVFPPAQLTPNGRGWDRWLICGACFDDVGDEFHLGSRLMVVRCGMNYSERLQKNISDTYYYLWEQDHFRLLLHLPWKQFQQ